MIADWSWVSGAMLDCLVVVSIAHQSRSLVMPWLLHWVVFFVVLTPEHFEGSERDQAAEASFDEVACLVLL